MQSDKTIKRKLNIPLEENSIEIAIGSKGNYELLKTYYRLTFYLSSRERQEKTKATFKDHEIFKINGMINSLADYGVRVIGFRRQDGELDFVSPAMNNVDMMVEKKYPLKENYSEKEISQMKNFAKIEKKISTWPEHLFDKEIPF